MKRGIALLGHAFAGALCATSFALSFLAVGWSQRFMQRRTLRAFFDAAERDEGFEDFCAQDPATATHARPPAWLGLRERLRPLWGNARLGVAASFNTWVLTMPGAILWLFSWYDGWNNSFTKGYEQAAVGPGLGLLGTALFIAAMLYVPLAQARQAATGDWRRFYDFRLVSALVRIRFWDTIRLALTYTVLSVPVMLFKTAPIAFDRGAAYAGMSDAEALDRLEGWFFVSGALVFGAYLVVRNRAALIYGRAIVDGVAAGAVAPERLGAFERAALGRLDLLEPRPRAGRSAVVRAVLGTGRRFGQLAAVGLSAVIWFGFVAQIYVSEFLNFHPIVGWLNQPLVQLPWFRYLPPGLTGGG